MLLIGLLVLAYVNENHKDLSYDFKDDTFHLRLDSNGSTGFSWEIEENDATAVKFLTNEEIQPETDNELVGAEGQTRITGQVLKNGETKFDLVYRQPWDKGQIDKRYRITLHVSQNKIQKLNIIKLEK